MTLPVEKKERRNRIVKYSVAATAATAASLAATQSADADIVFLDLSGSPIFSNTSVEAFVDILGFAEGASTISVTYATSAFSGANPLAPNSEFMIRGTGPVTQVRGNNGAQFGYYILGGYYYVSNVGSVGNFAANFNGTNNLSMYFDGFGGPFSPGVPGIAHFTFTNTQTGGTHNAWLHLQTDGPAGDRQATVTGITVDTIPEPASGMALLCLGAAGIAWIPPPQESKLVSVHSRTLCSGT